MCSTIGGDTSGDTDALSEQAGPDGDDFDEEPGLTPPCETAPMPGVPIHEEQNLAACFLDDWFKGFTSSGGKKPESGAERNNLKAKKLSMHSLNPVVIQAHSACFEMGETVSGARRMPYASTNSGGFFWG